MKNLKEKIEEFLKINYGYGYGSGSGDGYGYGSGDGSGSGYGYGYGYGYGSGDGILKFNNMPVHIIDEIPTIIINIKNNVAKGYILNKDLTTESCYIIKQNNLFAHGKTLHEARESLNNKLFEDMSTEERIDMFLQEFELDKKYLASKFYDWHNKLTGSCQMGRDNFIKNNGISLDDEYTVQEFISITKNDYGSNIIKELAEAIKCNNYFTN